jgi:hypothetical protein
VDRPARPVPIPAAGWLALAIVLIAATWLHRGALRAPFFADDYMFLDAVRRSSLGAALAAPDPLGNYFRPVGRQLWFWLIAHPGGASPALAHASGLGLFLIAVTLLFTLVAGAAGPAAGLVAATVLALHGTADVPVLWVSGAQDLIAVTAALAALLLFVRRHVWPAAVVLLAGLLAKETIALTPLVAVALAPAYGERPGRALRRVWPMGVALALWAAAWLVTLPRRPALGAETHLDPRALVTVFIGLVRATFGLEWAATGEPARYTASDLAPLLLGLASLGAGLLWLSARFPTGSAAHGRPRAPAQATAVAGLVWALAGALPVAAVMPIWSAYHFLFAMCGCAALAGALLASAPPVATVGVVALVAGLSAHTRALPGFATRPGALTPQSHVTRAYLVRGMTQLEHALGMLRRARPTVPESSTLLFAGVPANVSFQTGDGPVVRWVYDDSTLRSRFLGAFRIADATRGPVFFFEMRDDTLREVTGPDSLRDLGQRLLIGDAPEASRDLLELRVRDHPGDTGAWYPLGLLRLATGDEPGGREALGRAGLTVTGGPTPEIDRAFAVLAAGDTARALAVTRAGVAAHALDPGVHALLADLELSHDRGSYTGALETYAALVLGPGDAVAWRRWAMVLALYGRDRPALAALERYDALAGPKAETDPLARAVREQITPRLPGGAEAQREVSR